MRLKGAQIKVCDRMSLGKFMEMEIPELNRTFFDEEFPAYVQPQVFAFRTSLFCLSMRRYMM